MIGAVGALPNRQQARLEEHEHRESWDGMRLAESMVDSTPFLEGSCMMWRPSCLAIDDLSVGSNADDAQIAGRRTRGWRTVVDTGSLLMQRLRNRGTETPKSSKGSGVAAAADSASQAGNGENARYVCQIMRRQFHFHITAPLALAVACISAIMRWVFIALYGWPAVHARHDLHLGFTVAEILCVLVVAQSERKNNGPLSLLVDGFQAWVVGRSLFTTARGTSLHMWERHTERA